MIKKSVVFLSVFLFLVSLVNATDCTQSKVLCVDDTSGPNQEYSTISQALDDAFAGYSVEIFNGIYREHYTIKTSVKNWDGLIIKAADGQDQVYWQEDREKYATTGAGLWSMHSGSVYKTANGEFSGGKMWAIFYEHSGGVNRMKRELSLGDVNQDDEFFHDSSSGVVYVRLADKGSGRDPDNYVIRLSNNGGAGLLEIFPDGTRDIKDITVEGINFRYGLLGTPGGHVKGVIFSNELWPNGDPDHDLIGITIQDCRFTYNGMMAMTFSGVPGSDVADGPTDILITDCYFNDNGGMIHEADQALATVSAGYGVGKMTVQDSYFDNNYRYQIGLLGPDHYSVRPDKGLIVQRNIIKGGNNYAQNWGHDSSFGIRVAKNAGDVVIRNNIISGMAGDGISVQYHPTVGHKSLIIEGNTIAYNCQLSASLCRGVNVDNEVKEELLIKSNIIWGHRRGRTSDYNHELRIRGDPPIIGLDIDYNLIDIEYPGGAAQPFFYESRKTWNQWESTDMNGHNPDQHSITGSFSDDTNFPQFVDNKLDGSGDYHILPSSPARDVGVPISLSVDVDGDARSNIDIGADEYVEIDGPYCGDTQCNPGECSSCPGDCSLSDCHGNGDCNSGLSDGDEDCQDDPNDCIVSSDQICCSGQVFQGDCCSDTDCTSPEFCHDHYCSATSSETIFSDVDLYLGDADNWEPLNPSRWVVLEDSGSLRYGIIEPEFPELSGSRLGEYSLIKARTYGDFTMTAKVKSPISDPSNNFADYALVFGFQDPDDYLYMMFNAHPPFNQLYKVVDGQREEIATATGPSFSDNIFHEVSLTRKGELIQVYFDGSVILDANDQTFSSGKVGIGGFDNPSLWDDIIIRETKHHSADTQEPFGCISLPELMSFIALWKQDSVTYPTIDMMQAIELWKQGCQ